LTADPRPPHATAPGGRADAQGVLERAFSCDVHSEKAFTLGKPGFERAFQKAKGLAAR
jgi:hypothetical protein